MNPLLEMAIAAAEKAGAEILKLYETTEFDTKKDGSPVTIADMRSNEVLTAHLEKTGIPILSEESAGISLPYPDKLWIIDPLDGTRDFLAKNADFCVMIGLLEKGEPVLGVVYAPAYETLYYAEKGFGAFRVQNELTTQLYISSDESAGLRFLTSVNHFIPEMEEIRLKLNAESIPKGSVGLKAALMAENGGDFFFYLGKLGEWDICAPQIIAIEAGGSVTDKDGNPVHYGTADHRFQNGIVFSNTACHVRILEAISQGAPSKA